MKAPAMQQLVTDLLAEFQRDARGRKAAQRLAQYGASADDWRGYAHFKADVYTRNLVARNEHFEMLVLCWGAGQESPIHDHAGQHCWMAILDGHVDETQFRLPATPGALIEGATKTFARGQVAYIHDDIGLHRVRPAAGASAVSLHLYSRPIDVCKVFDQVTGRVLEKTLLYHSVDGRAVGDAPRAR